MAILKLFGDNTVCNLWLRNTDSKYISQSELNKLSLRPFADNAWDENTVIRANFHVLDTSNKLTDSSGKSYNTGDISGGNFDGGNYSDVDYYKIYKTFGSQKKLHKVLETNPSTTNTTTTIAEDFLVGSKCPITYTIVPMVIDGEKQIPSVMLQTASIEFDDGVIRVIGLIQDKDNPNKYLVDMSQIWHLNFNLSNSGFTNNMAKSYNDTLHRFQQKHKGNGNYRTIPIEGLLGKYDCESNEYIDTYDDIIEWERFMNNDELKALIDLRGIITLGDIESNSFSYEEHGAGYVSVNFSFRQLEDIDNVEIISAQSSINLAKYNGLVSSDGMLLQTTEDDTTSKILLVEKGDD